MSRRYTPAVAYFLHLSKQASESAKRRSLPNFITSSVLKSPKYSADKFVISKVTGSQGKIMVSWAVALEGTDVYRICCGCAARLETRVRGGQQSTNQPTKTTSTTRAQPSSSTRRTTTNQPINWPINQNRKWNGSPNQETAAPNPQPNPQSNPQPRPLRIPPPHNGFLST